MRMKEHKIITYIYLYVGYRSYCNLCLSTLHMYCMYTVDSCRDLRYVRLH